MAKRIAIIYAGGTIGMQATTRGYQPHPGLLQQEISKSHLSEHPDLPLFDIIEYDPLLESANAHYHHWLTIARDIVARYDDYDGFVVLHGTDTLAYAASALSFMLEGLSKPVILTGAQIPLCRARSDGYHNILDSLLFATHDVINEVCVCFAGHLLRGNRSQKQSSQALRAFVSPNYPILGRVGSDIQLETSYLLPPSTEPLRLATINACNIAVLSFHPSLSNQVYAPLLTQKLDGIILRSYGSGNIALDPEFMQLLQQAHAQGTVIINCSQCQHGSVDMSRYETGQHLLDLGVISGQDLTDEAALAKLAFLCSQAYDQASVARLLQTNLRGEMSGKYDQGLSGFCSNDR